METEEDEKKGRKEIVKERKKVASKRLEYKV